MQISAIIRKPKLLAFATSTVDNYCTLANTGTADDCVLYTVEAKALVSHSTFDAEIISVRCHHCGHRFSSCVANHHLSFTLCTLVIISHQLL